MATLASLPSEIKLMILDHLPVREIVKCRQVDKSFNELITTYEKTLLKRTQSKLSEMSDTIEQLCFFRVSETVSAFWLALHIYFKHRGIYSPKQRRVEARNFVELWTRRLEDQSADKKALRNLVRHILWVHVRHHVRRTPRAQFLLLEQEKYQHQFPIRGSGFNSPADWKLTNGRLTYPSYGLWDSDVSEKGPGGRLELIQNPLGWCSVLGSNLVAWTLDISPIPMFACDIYGYKVRSKAVYDLIHKAFEKRIKLDGFCKAAAIEELYIY